jgi:hypothetical protein
MLTAKCQGRDPTAVLPDLGFRFLAVTAGGAIVSAPEDVRKDFSGGLAVSRVVLATAARLVMAFGHHTEAGTRYLMFFNAAAVPANGTAPDISAIELAASPNGSFSLAVPPFLFTIGLVWALSSTDTLLTISTLTGASVTTYFRG